MSRVLWAVAITGMLLGGRVAAADPVAGPAPLDEAALQKQYDGFVAHVNFKVVATDYPKVVDDIESGDPERQAAAVKTLAETGRLDVIPWIVPLLDAKDPSLRVCSGFSIQKVVETLALKRRDPSHPEKVVLLPPRKEDPDLRPLAWIALKMFRMPDDGNTHAYAATIVRYLEAPEFEADLRACLRSRHPAVQNAAIETLKALDLQVDAKAVAVDGPAAPGGAPAGRIVFDLTDGSRIIGTPAADQFAVQTEYGEIRVKWAAVRTSQWNPEDHTARLVLENGDHVTGRVTTETVEVKAAFGTVTIPMPCLRRVGTTDSKTAYALRFDDRQNYVRVPGDPSLDPVREMTLECWFKTTSSGNISMIGKRRWEEDGIDNGYQLHASGGCLYGLFEGRLIAGGPVSDGRWHHAAMTWDGKTRRLFLDGAKTGEDSPGLWTPSEGEFRIGAIHGSHPNSFFDGTISQARLSKVDRYHGQNFTPEARFSADADTVACWNFSEGFGDTLYDETGNGHDGTFVGSPPPEWVEDSPPLAPKAPDAPTPTRRVRPIMRTIPVPAPVLPDE